MLKFLVYLQNLLAEPLRRDDRGVTAVEYGLIVAGIAALIVATVFVLGRTLNGVFANINGLI
jgi:pilus assembly protein Flp/PilA